MFDEMDVQELCNAIALAFYDGNNEQAVLLCKELTFRIEYTSI